MIKWIPNSPHVIRSQQMKSKNLRFSVSIARRHVYITSMQFVFAILHKVSATACSPHASVSRQQHTLRKIHSHLINRMTYLFSGWNNWLETEAIVETGIG